jgi:TatA/E family protein of Tat protein translocase
MSMSVQPLLAFMEGLGGPEVFLVMVVILVLFGGEKLPEFARGAGKLIREFKKASSGVEEEFKRALEEDDRKKSIAAPVSPPVPLSPPLALASDPAVPALTEAAPAPTPATPATAAPSTAEGTPVAPSLKPPPPPKMLPGEGDDLGL